MRTFALTAAMVALLAAVPVAATDATGTALPRDFFGVTANGPLDAVSIDLRAEEALMAKSGVQAVRLAINWNVLQPTAGKAPDFGIVDARIADATANGLDVLPIVLGSPKWAALKPSNPLSPPRQPATYARFLTLLIARYGPGGAFWKANPKLAPRPIRAWEIWNEPELSNGFPVSPWQPTYVKLLRAAHAAIKAADPGATVVLGGLTNYSWKDLASLYKAGAKGLFDVISLHPYTRTPSGVLKITGYVRQVMKQNGNGAMPIWITELTWSSALGDKALINKYGWVTTVKGQALRLTQAYNAIMKARLALGIQRVYWYTWASIDRTSPNAFDYSGLRTVKTDGTIVDKPAARAFRLITKQYETG